jgi:SAM-dependent methyltransferase
MSYAGENPVIGYDFQGFAENYWHHYVQSGAGLMAMLEPLLRLRPQNGALLDVGCGFGFVPHFWQNSGRGPAVGLETSEYGRIGREKLGVDIRHSFYAPLKDSLDGRFRYVFASEVLEHVADPNTFLAEISGGLSADGILILTTPAAEGVAKTTDHTNLLASLSPGFHYFLASRLGLAHLLRQAGFRHVRVESTGTRLFAWASHHTLPDIAPVGEGWDAYIAYLECLSDHSDHHVAGGARYRLFKDTLNSGDITRAAQGWRALGDLARDAYQIDLSAGFSDADPAQSEVTSYMLKKADFSQSPSWLGCALFFGAKFRHSQGAAAYQLIPVLCRAIAEIGRDLDDLAQFAQEPAHFLPQARELLARLLARNGMPQSAAVAPSCDTPFEKYARLIQTSHPRRAEYLLWRGLIMAITSGAGATAEGHFWRALAKSTMLDLGPQVREICFEAAVARMPQNARLQADTARFAFEMGRYRRAYSAYRSASHVEPQRAAYWSNLAASALALTCYRLAREHAQRALSCEPDHQMARKLLAHAEIALDRPVAAFAVLAPLLSSTADPEVRLLEIGVTLARGELEVGLFDLAKLVESVPNVSKFESEFHDVFRRFLNHPALSKLLDGLGLIASHEKIALPDVAPCNGPARCDVVVLADPEMVHLRGCLESLATNGGEWIDRVCIVAPRQRLDLAHIDGLPFPIETTEDLNAALHAGSLGQILLICAEAALLPDTLPPLFRSLDRWPTAPFVAAWPLAGPISAHPLPPARQSDEPLPDAALTAAIRDWTRGPAEVQAPLLPAGCLLMRRSAITTFGPLETGPISGAVYDLCLRALNVEQTPILVLDAPVALRDQLAPPNRAALYARHSALRVLAAESLVDKLLPIVNLRRNIQEDMALHLPQLPPDLPPSAIVPRDLRGAARWRWLTVPPGTVGQTEEICLFVAFAPDGTLPPLTKRYLAALRALGLRTVLCLNMINHDAPTDPSLAAQADHVLLRSNGGYDFAAWADILRAEPALWDSGLLMFANDSLVGPLDGLGTLMNRMRRSKADFIAMTDSRMYRPHVQSYLFSYKRAGLASAAIRCFWSEIEVLDDKQQVIQSYELALLDLAKTRAGLQVEVLFPTENLLGRDRRRLIALSPTHHLWRQLLRHGFPFVKAELLRLPPQGVRAGDVLQALVDRGEDTEELCLHIEETNVNRLPLTV